MISLRQRIRRLRPEFRVDSGLMASITWHVSTLAAAVLCGLLILAPITDASADIRIGSISNIDSSDTVINGVTLDAPIMAASRAKLLDPEHFRGEGDAFPPRVVTQTTDPLS